MLRSELWGRVRRAAWFAIRGTLGAVALIALLSGLIWVSDYVAPELMIALVVLLCCAAYGFATYSPPVGEPIYFDEEQRARLNDMAEALRVAGGGMAEALRGAVTYTDAREETEGQTTWVILDGEGYAVAVFKFEKHEPVVDLRVKADIQMLRVPYFHADRLSEINAGERQWRWRRKGEPLAGMLARDDGAGRPIATSEDIDAYLNRHGATAD